MLGNSEDAIKYGNYVYYSNSIFQYTPAVSRTVCTVLMLRNIISFTSYFYEINIYSYDAQAFIREIKKDSDT